MTVAGHYGSRRFVSYRYSLFSVLVSRSCGCQAKLWNGSVENPVVIVLDSLPNQTLLILWPIDALANQAGTSRERLATSPNAKDQEE